LKKFNLLNSSKCTIIIGNHDIYGGVHLAEDILNFPKRCNETNYNQKVEQFTSAFNETYHNIKTINNRNIYPFIKEFDDFIFLGLNSIAEYSFLRNPFASNGKIGSTQIESSRILLDSKHLKNKKVLVLTHHHFCKNPITLPHESTTWQRIEKQTIKLRNKKRLLGFFKELNTELVLHGHLHESSFYKRKKIKFLNAGGTILLENKGELNYNMIEISSNSISYSIENIPLTSQNQKFLPYTSKGQLFDLLNLPKLARISVN
jgi:predicted phosphodiesterase